MLPLRLAAAILLLAVLSVLLVAAIEPNKEAIAIELEDSTASTRLGFSYNTTEQAKNITEMQEETIRLWYLYLEDEGHKVDSLARAKELEELALYLALAVDKYQRISVNWRWWNPKRQGATLPVNADAHLVLAVMAGFESKVEPGTVGNLGEVGILQCHRWCRDGYTKKEIIENPKLGIDLGVKFLTKSIDQCGSKLDSFEDKKLQDREWSKPLALYGAGTKAIKKGKCIVTRFALARIQKMRALRKIIKAQQGVQNVQEVYNWPTSQRAAGNL